MTANPPRRPRQTAGNNADLARIKRAMNGPIFREASRIYNEEGRDAARRYMGQYFNDEARERVLPDLFRDE